MAKSTKEPKAKPANPGIVTAEEFSEFENKIHHHLFCFLHNRRWRGIQGRPEHFWCLVELLWPKGSPKHFVRHPWAERMVEEACRQNYLGLDGSSDSGKSDFGAIWALINWWAAPADTLVLVTSTSLKESRKRIWGSIKEYFLATGGIMPGKLVDSMGQIKPEPCPEIPMSDRCGIALIAGEKSKESESIGKLIGIKNQRIILIADEMPELSESLIRAAHSNLSGRPYFQMVGIGNFASIYDPFGVFTTPLAGWNSLTLEDESWKTERGICLRFDGLKSPNILLGQDVWPIYGSRNLREHLKLKENSLEFWRMCRAFPCPEGAEQAIYCEADLVAGHVHDRAVWQSSRTRVSTLDPAFTTGGDRCPQMFGWLGMTKEGIYTLELDKYLLLVEDARLKDKSRAFQIAQQFKDNCLREGVLATNAAIDASGAGIAFGEICVEIWSPQILRVQFGGSASDAIVSETDTRPSNEVYVNRVSELWFQGTRYVRSNQIRGLTPEVARELCSRKYTTRKDSGCRIVVEPKDKMKLLVGKSPDLADCFFVMLELCRQRHGFHAGDGLATSDSKGQSWEDFAKQSHSIFEETVSPWQDHQLTGVM